MAGLTENDASDEPDSSPPKQPKGEQHQMAVAIDHAHVGPEPAIFGSRLCDEEGCEGEMRRAVRVGTPLYGL